MTLTTPPPAPESPADPSVPRERWLFLVSGGLLLLTLLVAIGRERHWGEPQFTVQVVAPRADGLQAGQEVRLSGMPIGRVESLALQKDARVAVTLRINERFRSLVGPRSRVQSGLTGLVVQSFVNVTPNPRPDEEAAKQPLPTLAYDPPPDLNQLIANLAQSRSDLDQTLTLATRLQIGRAHV